ncbi:hypothetical protein BDR07DRAFT_283475 [Suillus spraguei]|nr:hypothetical protein BDR07DRAFT_283475 [Suillus spraguei]
MFYVICLKFNTGPYCEDAVLPRSCLYICLLCAGKMSHIVRLDSNVYISRCPPKRPVKQTGCRGGIVAARNGSGTTFKSRMTVTT